LQIHVLFLPDSVGSGSIGDCFDFKYSSKCTIKSFYYIEINNKMYMIFEKGSIRHMNVFDIQQNIFTASVEIHSDIKIDSMQIPEILNG
jgi:hypothetical protein